MKEVNLDLPVDRVSPNGIQKLKTSGIIEPLRNEVLRLLIEKNFILGNNNVNFINKEIVSY